MSKLFTSACRSRFAGLRAFVPGREAAGAKAAAVANRAQSQDGGAAPVAAQLTASPQAVHAARAYRAVQPMAVYRASAMRFLFAAVIALLFACSLGIAAPGQALAVHDTTVTVESTSYNAGVSYNAYAVFDCDVSGSGGTATAANVSWASAAVRDAVLAGMRSAGYTGGSVAQDAADWLQANLSNQNAATVAAPVADAADAGTVTARATIAAGATQRLDQGYYLVLSDDESLPAGASGTAPVFVLVAGESQTISPKGGVPTLEKHIYEDDANGETGAWQRAADATVGDDVWRRDLITVPAGISGFGGGVPYPLLLTDELSSGLTSEKLLSSLRVFVRPGSGGDWDTVSGEGAQAADGWTEIDVRAATASEVSGDGAGTSARTASASTASTVSASARALTANVSTAAASGSLASLFSAGTAYADEPCYAMAAVGNCSESGCPKLLVRFSDVAALLQSLGADLSDGCQVCVTYSAPFGSDVKVGANGGTTTQARLGYPASPLASAMGKATSAETPRQTTYAYTWRCTITKRPSNDNDASLAGAVLRITDDRGRRLNAEGAWVGQGEDGFDSASVTTGEDGTVSFSGADSGAFTVEELSAPQGYERFEGSPKLTISTEGLDFNDVKSANVKANVKAEAPLRVDAVDCSGGQVSITLVDEPEPGAPGQPGEADQGGPGEQSPVAQAAAALLPKTGDPASFGPLAAVALCAALALLLARRRRNRDERPAGLPRAEGGEGR